MNSAICDSGPTWAQKHTKLRFVGFVPYIRVNSTSGEEQNTRATSGNALRELTRGRHIFLLGGGSGGGAWRNRLWFAHNSRLLSLLEQFFCYPNSLSTASAISHGGDPIKMIKRSDGFASIFKCRRGSQCCPGLWRVDLKVPRDPVWTLVQLQRLSVFGECTSIASFALSRLRSIASAVRCCWAMSLSI